MLSMSGLTVYQRRERNCTIETTHFQILKVAEHDARSDIGHQIYMFLSERTGKQPIV